MQKSKDGMLNFVTWTEHDNVLIPCYAKRGHFRETNENRNTFIKRQNRFLLEYIISSLINLIVPSFHCEHFHFCLGFDQVDD